MVAELNGETDIFESFNFADYCLLCFEKQQGISRLIRETPRRFDFRTVDTPAYIYIYT
jgi:hypothetical protein